MTLQTKKKYLQINLKHKQRPKGPGTPKTLKWVKSRFQGVVGVKLLLK